MSSLSDGAGQYVYNSYAQYKPFGAYQTEPVTNPSLTDRGYTGHRHNNTGTYDLGLIYMNARYYMPEIGRFISADTIVLDPQNPQSYNKYSYVLNSTGHRESDGCEYEGCLPTDDLDNSGQTSPSVIAASESNDPLTRTVEGTRWPDWTHSRLFPDYFTIQGSGAVFTISFTIDNYSNVYISGGLNLGVELAALGLSVRAAGGWLMAEQVVSQDALGVEWAFQSDSPTEAQLESHIQGPSVSASLGGGPPPFLTGPGVDGVLAIKPLPSVSAEGGLYTVQAGFGASYAGLLYDAGSATPWFWQR